ncbi:MAG: D-alanyl-D-alanine endopeptidase [Pseudomonadota bacterium]|nr:D-alanyl-D-alanine endopeptidase [Pseudomonadota bacterium]
MMTKIIFFLFSLPLLCTAAQAEDAVVYSPIQVAKLSGDSLARKAAITMKWRALNPKKLKLKSASALVVDSYGNDVYTKDADKPRPIASITKLMTAMVTLDAKLPLEQKITIRKADRDRIRGTGSRLKYGARLSRKEMITLALMSSENRAAAALGRTYPGGMQAFIKAMNKKAASLGMRNSHFDDPVGLKSGNVASARDLVTMVRAALKYPLIREATTTRKKSVYPYKGRGPLRYGNTNRLLKSKDWEIRLSKTGYINEAGRCLTMQAEIAHQPLVIVLLNSYGKLTPTGDSNRIRKWIEGGLIL